MLGGQRLRPDSCKAREAVEQNIFIVWHFSGSDCFQTVPVSLRHPHPPVVGDLCSEAAAQIHISISHLLNSLNRVNTQKFLPTWKHTHSWNHFLLILGDHGKV